MPEPTKEGHAAPSPCPVEHDGPRVAVPAPPTLDPEPALSEPGNVPVLCVPNSTARAIVYVEDDALNIALMKDLLAELDDVKLLTAFDAELGIELIRARQPDVVIMDINLPGMSGLEATHRLSAWPETRHIPVIALSAMSGRDVAPKASPFYRYLAQPVRVDELLSVLDELLRRRGRAN